MLYSHAGIFSEWPKPAQPYFLSLGVTTISMVSLDHNVLAYHSLTLSLSLLTEIDICKYCLVYILYNQSSSSSLLIQNQCHLFSLATTSSMSLTHAMRDQN